MGDEQACLATRHQHHLLASVSFCVCLHPQTHTCVFLWRRLVRQTDYICVTVHCKAEHSRTKRSWHLLFIARSNISRPYIVLSSHKTQWDERERQTERWAGCFKIIKLFFIGGFLMHSTKHGWKQHQLHFLCKTAFLKIIPQTKVMP